jgi:hypothetical protein
MCNDGPRVRDKTRQKLDPNYPKAFTGEAHRFSAPNQETLPVFSKDFDDTAYLPETRPVPFLGLHISTLLIRNLSLLSVNFSLSRRALVSLAERLPSKIYNRIRWPWGNAE